MDWKEPNKPLVKWEWYWEEKGASKAFLKYRLNSAFEEGAYQADFIGNQLEKNLKIAY